MTFRINDGPFAGQEGSKVQSRVIRDRLLREAERNIAIKVTDSDETDSFTVSGRGELQLAILIENMRREGFETDRLAPQGRYQDRRRNRPALRADRRNDHRHRRRAHRRCGAETVGAPRRPDGNATIGRRAHAHGVLGADARPAWLSVGTVVGQPRHGRDEPLVPLVCALQGRNSGPPPGRSDFQRHAAKPPPIRSSTCKIAGSS